MSESAETGASASISLPIVVHWTRSSRWGMLVGWLFLIACGLVLVLAARPVHAEAVRVAGIVALVLLAWSLLRGWGRTPVAGRAPTEAHVSRGRWLILYGAAIGVAAYVIHSPFALESVAVRALGAFGLLFFGPIGVAWLISSRSRRVAVRIDENGILDQTTLLASDQPIAWNELQSVTTRMVSGQQFIVLGHVQPEDFVSRQARWRRPLLRMNRAFTGSPIALHASGLDRSLDDLVSTIRVLLPGAEER